MKPDIFFKLKANLVEEKHYPVIHFLETVYEFEDKPTWLKCLNGFANVGHFGVVGAQYEIINAEQSIDDYKEVYGFDDIGRVPAIYFSVGDEFNPEELIIPLHLAYHYFKIAADDYLKVFPTEKASIEKILARYPVTAFGGE